MTQDRRLSIIIPSYNDARIVSCINSVRRFDDIGCVRIVLIDGGSNEGVQSLIRPLLGSDDVFISEPDCGIFDALNKGLNHCTTEFLGWLGSDDIYTCRVPASLVVGCLEDSDLFVAATAVFRGGRIRRVTHAAPARNGWVKFGLHNPHFSTFGRAALLTSDRFEVGIPGSDIAYFIRIFERLPRVCTSREIGTLMEEGGFSTKSYRRMLATNASLLSIYARHIGPLLAPVALLLKLGCKVLSLAYYKVVRMDRASFMLSEGDLKSGPV